MTHNTGPEVSNQPLAEAERKLVESVARERAVGSMVSASFMAVLGTLIFAWAMRTPDYPWLFAVGAVPWLAGVVVFARALWQYTHL